MMNALDSALPCGGITLTTYTRGGYTYRAWVVQYPMGGGQRFRRIFGATYGCAAREAAEHCLAGIRQAVAAGTPTAWAVYIYGGSAAERPRTRRGF